MKLCRYIVNLYNFEKWKAAYLKEILGLSGIRLRLVRFGCKLQVPLEDAVKFVMVSLEPGPPNSWLVVVCLVREPLLECNLEVAWTLRWTTL